MYHQYLIETQEKCARIDHSSDVLEKANCSDRCQLLLLASTVNRCESISTFKQMHMKLFNFLLHDLSP